MTCWLTDEGLNTTLVLAMEMDGWCVVSERILVSLLSVSVDPCEMSWAEAALALAPLCEDWMSDDLLRPFFLMWVFQKLKLFAIQFCLSVISVGARPDLDKVFHS